MGTARLGIRFASEDVHRDFHRFADFGHYPAIAHSVRAVAVHPAPSPDLARDSDWEIIIGDTILRWNQWESVDPDRLRIEFDQSRGDFTLLHGFWQLHPLIGGCDVWFEATFDLGLSGVMDPIAEHALRQITCSVLAGLFGDITILGASVNTTGVSTP
jgi:hypothetical protein